MAESGARTRAISAILYMWSATDSGSRTSRSTQPVRRRDFTFPATKKKSRSEEADAGSTMASFPELEVTTRSPGDGFLCLHHSDAFHALNVSTDPSANPVTKAALLLGRALDMTCVQVDPGVRLSRQYIGLKMS